MPKYAHFQSYFRRFCSLSSNMSLAASAWTYLVFQVLPHSPQPAFLTMPSPTPVLKAAFLTFLLHTSLKYIFNTEIITHILFRMIVISDVSTTNTSIVSNDINHAGANITYIHKPILGSHSVVNCSHHKHHGLE